MWKLKKINDVDYLFSIEIRQNDQHYKFFLTDFCKLWCVEMSVKEVIDRCKDINQWLEAEDETLLSETLNLFDVDRQDVEWKLSSTQLHLESTFSGIKFNYRLDIQLMTEENYFKMVVSPLLLIIKNLQHQKEFLQKLLKKKDIEIAEYKLDGAVISRKNIETPVFHETLLSDLLNEKLEHSFNKPTDLIDDNIISLYSETFARMNRKDETPSEPLNLAQNENIVKEEKNGVKVKVPKKNEGDVASTKSEPGSSALPVPVANPIRKKPQPRKLKNL